MLKIQNLTKTYGKKTAIENMSITFGCGVTGLLGPNGAGKSSLMRILSTIDGPTSGMVLYKEENIQKKPNAIRKELGYLPQDFGVYPNMNATEFLEYMAAMKGLNMRAAKKRIKELLLVLNLSDVGKRFLGGFSGGMKQRVGIAQALLNDPKVLIIDEPTVGLDPKERIQFRNLLTALAADRTILLSTHIVSDVESIAGNIVVMNQGRILASKTPRQLIMETEGKVWDAAVPLKELEQVQRNFVVSNSAQKVDGIHVRIVSDTQPFLHAVPVDPGLEDAYLYITGGRYNNGKTFGSD